MPRIIVMGASEGGVQALRTVISGLPAHFPAPVMAVLHVGAGHSILPSILNDLGSLPASHARNGEHIRPGHIFVAPPDHHLLISDGVIELSHGPRENWARPAIDPLFRTAAESYGRDAVGVILTGRLNDGTSGLYEIKRRGGVAVVQDPQEAEVPAMPQSALDNVPVDYNLPLSQIPDLLTRLAEESARSSKISYHGAKPMEEPTVIAPAAQTCAECGGAMIEEMVGGLTRFRCHIGHAMTAEVLAATQLDTIESNLSRTFRLLNERSALCREMARKHRTRGDSHLAEQWQRAADEATAREAVAKQLTEMDWTNPESGRGKTGG